MAALVEYGYDAKILAGGQSLIPMMKLRMASPAILVDISRLESLSTIGESGETLRIGALVKESDLERSPVVARWAISLLDTSRVIADPLVRNLATVGGNVAHGDPANDHPATMVAVDASFTLVGPHGSRSVSAEDFFLDFFATALEPDEILTEIRIPKQTAGTGSAYVKHERQVGDYAIAGAAARVRSSNGVIDDARIALTNLGPIPIRPLEAESMLRGEVPSERILNDAATAAAASAEPWDDLRGTAEYRRRIATMVTRQALEMAWRRAEGGTRG